MIVITFSLYDQCWIKHDVKEDRFEEFETKVEALESIPRTAQQTVVVTDPRFARHPRITDRYIGLDGAKTFYSVYREGGGQYGTTLNFEDWASQYLDRQLD